MGLRLFCAYFLSDHLSVGRPTQVSSTRFIFNDYKKRLTDNPADILLEMVALLPLTTPRSDFRNMLISEFLDCARRVAAHDPKGALVATDFIPFHQPSNRTLRQKYRDTRAHILANLSPSPSA